VVAARQLAEDARARRAVGECALSAVIGPRRQHWLRTRRARAGLVASAAAVSAGCGLGGTACPAIGYVPAVVVQLDGWPAASGRSVELVCPGCGEVTDGGPGDSQVLPIGTEAVFSLPGALPEQVTVRVLADGQVAAEVTVEPEFARVGGSEECGGPSSAQVVVPAP
jgi:hypothetical protein